jgi:Ni/Fe-hydrogenase subunit HybB-like protein
MASYTNDQFVMPSKMKTWSYALMGIGIFTLILGFIILKPFDSHDGHATSSATRFWAVLLQNSVYWLLLVNASMFFVCATTLAFGGWQMAFRRVPEAISAVVKILGPVALVILLSLIFFDRHDIYHWLDKEAVANDKILSEKSGFLNPYFFGIWSTLTIFLWTVLGARMRKLSQQLDENPIASKEEGKKYIWTNTVSASFYVVVFGLTVASTIPWFWLMSIDAHWFSTMFSWYTFASSFVAGMSLIAIFVVYLKNLGYLEYVNEEHIHDIGKFMFAFSVFWTYLWFSQYMLIWYANIPEEVIYFKNRVQGNFKGIFFLNLILNFLCPLLILLKRGAKRNYTMLTFMAVLIIFGHWVDFWQMVMPGTVKNEAHLSWFEFGIAALFIGIIIYGVGKALEKAPLLAKNHPFIKESIIHHT